MTLLDHGDASSGKFRRVFRRVRIPEFMKRNKIARRLTDGDPYSKPPEETMRRKMSRNLDSVMAQLKESSNYFRDFTLKVGQTGVTPRSRLIQKHGVANISLVNVPSQGRMYFSDIFTTVIEVKWRWCLLAFALSFAFSWTIFTFVYYGAMLINGDFAHLNDTDWVPCVRNIESLVSVFLFSLESQSTIGYGFRYPTELCPVVVVTVSIQSVVGLTIQTLMTGVVFAKLARPKKRASTLLFSKNGVICLRDGRLCLCFRVGDMRRSQLAEAHVRLQMINKRITDEGELLPFYQYDMDVGYDQGLDRIFLIWPITICHVIDERSPLYEMSKEDLSTARFELIALLEGVVASTGSTTQARTSYVASEIIWGHRFEKLVTYQLQDGDYRIDFGKFNSTYEVATPNESAKQLDEMQELGLAPTMSFKRHRSSEIENHGQTPYATIQNFDDDRRPSIIKHKFEVIELHDQKQSAASSNCSTSSAHDKASSAEDLRTPPRDGDGASPPRGIYSISGASNLAVGEPYSMNGGSGSMIGARPMKHLGVTFLAERSDSMDGAGASPDAGKGGSMNSVCKTAVTRCDSIDAGKKRQRSTTLTELEKQMIMREREL